MSDSQKNKLNRLREYWRGRVVPDFDSAAGRVRQWKKEGLVVSFTNGCFDLLHPGHMHSLMEARSFGDKLVVGLNSDESVRKLKGVKRPIIPLEDRISMLAAVRWVDLVVPFDEEDPGKLIEAVLPDVLVKGGDYLPGEIAGAETVLKNGGKVYTLGFIEGYSSSRLLKKIREE
ncbi:MAG: D-glycero-beta-D-manno-heptose 1-phosphate adenylyltransferase [Saprospirales bacterium]|nr:MAG: D-glycero-beta-D-manno-heptose 1-phosphate adenylyltransferase [Saprospirales bacterium]